ncbi:MAG: SIMPL domain-containing protein [Bacteroidetes bacterium]|nr:SIMPL domain-containing protein [Bacteroidota bacterium]
MQRIFLIIILPLITLFPSKIDAQLLTPAEKNIPYIEVIGSASQKVVPDKIFLSIGLSEKSIQKKTWTISEQETSLFQVLDQLQISRDQLALSDTNASIIRRKKRETGVRFEKEYILELKNASQLSAVFTQLQQRNIKEVNVTKTESSKIIELRKEVRIEAIKLAKAKAEYLLEAIGETIGRPLEIRELPDERVARRTFASNGIITQKDKEDLLAEFEQIEIKFSYYIKYSIN